MLKIISFLKSGLKSDNDSSENGSDSSSSSSADKLNEKEIKLIKSSWELISDKDEFGLAIMIRIFTEHKQIKNKWIFASNLETEAEMLSNSQVRYHAKKIVDVLNKILNLLTRADSFHKSDLDALDLVRLGRSHHHYNVQKDNFKVIYYSFNFCFNRNLIINDS
jgi:hypothetical protein